MTVLPIVINTLGMVTKALVEGLEELEIRALVDTLQITALLRSARILRRFLETWGDLETLKLHWNTINWSWKILKEVKKKIIRHLKVTKDLACKICGLGHNNWNRKNTWDRFGLIEV